MQSPDSQRNQGTEFLGRFFFKVGRFDILLRKCNALDDFSFDMIKTCQNFSSETFVPPIVCIKDQKALYKSRKKKDTFEKFLNCTFSGLWV